MHHDSIAVVDFGGQYAHLIATKVRRIGVLAEIRQPEDPIEAFTGYKGIILSGSPALSSHGEDSEYTKAIYELDIPILGLCFGHQEIAKHYGGEVIHGGREWGHADLHVTKPDHPLFAGLDAVEQVWMSHFDSVAGVGDEFEEFGYTTSKDGSPDHRLAAIGSDVHRRYGFQFHAEVDDTIHGNQMFANFVIGICGCEPTWSMEAFIAEEREKVRAQVGDESVFLLASGGVDSTVAAVILKDALGSDRVNLLHVDNGLMRKDESAKVIDLFQRLDLGEHLHFIDASDDFLGALEGLTDPEAKRHAIGHTFVDVFNREAERLGIQHHLLGQGTIYPDTVETGGTKRADTIKTHHNRVAVIEEMIAEGKVVEPLAELYKVEVREVGEELGIAHEALWRHPFPGPGLGVRCLCSDGSADTDDFERLVPETEAASQLRAGTAGPSDSLVGVKADIRAYEHPVLLSGDADWDTLLRAASSITQQVLGINRCIWNLGPDQPAEAHPVAGYMTRDRLDLLREADALVMEGLRRHDLYDEIWQCPTVLVPLSLGSGEEGELIVLRPIFSKRAMTATPVRLPDPLLDELRASILGLEGVTGLALDITSKPPGTIEWE